MEGWVASVAHNLSLLFLSRARNNQHSSTKSGIWNHHGFGKFSSEATPCTHHKFIWGFPFCHNFCKIALVFSFVERFFALDEGGALQVNVPWVVVQWLYKLSHSQVFPLWTIVSLSLLLGPVVCHNCHSILNGLLGAVCAILVLSIERAVVLVYTLKRIISFFSAYTADTFILFNVCREFVNLNGEFLEEKCSLSGIFDFLWLYINLETRLLEINICQLHSQS